MPAEAGIQPYLALILCTFSSCGTSSSFFTRQSILLWAIKTHRRNRQRFAVECEFLGKSKTVVRLQTAREVERYALSS